MGASARCFGAIGLADATELQNSRVGAAVMVAVWAHLIGFVECCQPCVRVAAGS